MRRAASTFFALMLSAGCTLSRQGVAPVDATAPGEDATTDGARTDAFTDALEDARDGGEDAPLENDASPPDAPILEPLDAGPPEGWAVASAHSRVHVRVASTGVDALDVVVPVALASLPGGALRVRDAAGVALPFEIEQSDADAGAILWVRFAILRAEGAMFDVYFDASSATSESDAAATWSGDYVGVYHFVEAAAVPDSAGGDLDGEFTEGTAPATTQGRFDRGLYFAGASSGYVEISDADGIAPMEFDCDEGEQRTYEAWFRSEVVGSMTLLHKEGRCKGFQLGFDSSGGLVGRLAIGGSGNACPSYSQYYVNVAATGEGVSLHDDGWHSVVLVVDRAADLLEIYVDGMLRDAQLGVTDTRNANEGSARIGATWDGTQRFLGEIDEVRVRRAAPSGARIALEHQLTRPGMVEVGAVERW